MSCAQAGNKGERRGRSPPRKIFRSRPGKICWIYFETIGHISKNFGPSQKTLCPSWCPKLVTGLFVHGFCHVENLETEVPFPHLPKFRISEHKEFVKTNGVNVWLVFFPYVVL